MPKEGWTSISIQDEIIASWKKTYDQNKEFCQHRGITSFTGFINSVMAGVLDNNTLLKLSVDSSLKRGMREFVSTKTD